MNKYQYQIKDRVFVSDSFGKYSATITNITHSAYGSGYLYQCTYDEGGYDWLLADELTPLEYHIGDYVESSIGIGKIIDIDAVFNMITVSYGYCQSECYYEYELKPAPKPSFLARLFGKGVYLYG